MKIVISVGVTGAFARRPVTILIVRRYREIDSNGNINRREWETH